MVSGEINDGILATMNEILTGVAPIRDAKKAAVFSTGTKQPSAAPVIKRETPTVLDSPTTNNVQDAPVYGGSKVPEKKALTVADSGEEPKGLTPSEKEKQDYISYRKELAQIRRSMGVDSVPSEPSLKTFKVDQSASKEVTSDKEQQVVVYKSEDTDDQYYDRHGSPIMKSSSATYRVTIDENHPDAMICPYWLESEATPNAEHTCEHAGDHEPYYHKVLDGKRKEPLECSFWREGRCYRGDKCGFAHYCTRHGLVKNMAGKENQKFPFTVAAEGPGGDERGLRDSRYAHGNPTPAPQKRDVPTSGREREDKALEENTAKFRAFLGASTPKDPVASAKKAPNRDADKWVVPKNLPNHAGFNPATYW